MSNFANRWGLAVPREIDCRRIAPDIRTMDDLVQEILARCGSYFYPQKPASHGFSIDERGQLQAIRPDYREAGG
jgi:hypothetical protein